MAEKIKLVQGDTRPTLVCAITDDTTNSPVNITGATIVLKFRAAGSTTLTATVPGVVANGATGQVLFSPASAPEMLQGLPGDYEGEIEITFPDGQIQTVFDTLRFKMREDF